MLMSRSKMTRHSGFTLLEVILSMAITMVLLYGIYTAMNINLRQAQQGRDLVERSTVARSLFARIANDIEPSLGLPDPGLFRSTDSGSSSTGGTSTGASTGSTTGATTGGATGGTEEELLEDPANVRLLAVQGDIETLRMFVSRVPREAYVERNTLEEQEGNEFQEGDQILSDQREIVYWFIPDLGNGSGGLARQEVKLVTADLESEPLAMGTAEEENYLLSSEVRSVTFSYWDGTSWLEEWDGTQLGADGVTPQGPPLAIEIIIELQFPGPTPESLPKTHTFRHVVHIPTANGPLPEVTGEEGTLP